MFRDYPNDGSTHFERITFSWSNSLTICTRFFALTLLTNPWIFFFIRSQFIRWYCSLDWKQWFFYEKVPDTNLVSDLLLHEFQLGRWDVSTTSPRSQNILRIVLFFLCFFCIFRSSLWWFLTNWKFYWRRRTRARIPKNPVQFRVVKAKNNTYRRFLGGFAGEVSRLSRGVAGCFSSSDLIWTSG